MVKCSWQVFSGVGQNLNESIYVHTYTYMHRHSHTYTTHKYTHPCSYTFNNSIPTHTLLSFTWPTNSTELKDTITHILSLSFMYIHTPIHTLRSSQAHSQARTDGHTMNCQTSYLNIGLPQDNHCFHGNGEKATNSDLVSQKAPHGCSSEPFWSFFLEEKLTFGSNFILTLQNFETLKTTKFLKIDPRV